MGVDIHRPSVLSGKFTLRRYCASVMKTQMLREEVLRAPNLPIAALFSSTYSLSHIQNIVNKKIDFNYGFH